MTSCLYLSWGQLAWSPVGPEVGCMAVRVHGLVALPCLASSGFWSWGTHLPEAPGPELGAPMPQAGQTILWASE